MINVYAFPEPPEDPTAEACDWLARLERGLSEHEDRELRAWLAANPARLGAVNRRRAGPGLHDRLLHPGERALPRGSIARSTR